MAPLPSPAFFFAFRCPLFCFRFVFLFIRFRRPERTVFETGTELLAMTLAHVAWLGGEGGLPPEEDLCPLLSHAEGAQYLVRSVTDRLMRMVRGREDGDDNDSRSCISIASRAWRERRVTRAHTITHRARHCGKTTCLPDTRWFASVGAWCCVGPVSREELKIHNRGAITSVCLVRRL